MPKKRERKTPAESDRNNRINPAARTAQTFNASSETNNTRRFFIGVTFILLPIVSLIIYRINYAPDISIHNIPIHKSGLVKPEITFREILAEYSKASENTSARYFPNPLLAYITPWNSKGYDMAKRFTSKFTHLSPVWYELKSEGSDLVLEGRHNADTGWISELTTNGNALVLPRVVLEAFPGDLFQKKHQWDKAIDLIVTECKDMGYDGIVLESWSRWAMFGVVQNRDLRSVGLHFIKQLAQALHSVSSNRNSDSSLQLIYVIPAPRSKDLQSHDFGPRDFHSLSDTVDGFSLMTYDFSGPYNPGPNAPLGWIHDSLLVFLGANYNKGLGNKIFVGINFYGNDFVLSKGGGGEAITGEDYLSLLKKQKPVLQWDEKSAEHYFTYSANKIQHLVFYPSLMSISMRLEEAKAWKAGISIWEIGQGLDYFFELL